MGKAWHLEGRESTRLGPQGLGLCILLFAAACAPRAPLVTQGPAGASSLPCAASVLSAEDYRVDQDEAGVTGEARLMSGDVGVSREFITVAMSDPSTMTATVEAFRLEAASHDLPVQRQSATPVRPSADAVELAQRIVDQCSG